MTRKTLVLVFMLLGAWHAHGQSQTSIAPAATPASGAADATGEPRPPSPPRAAPGGVTPDAPAASNAPAAATPQDAPRRGAPVQTEKTRPVRLTRFEVPPSIDGRLDEAVWKNAAVFKDFVQIQPGDNIAPSKPTEAMIGFDSKFLYLGFRAHDEKGKVVATVARRDAVFEEDNLSVMLDTYNDTRRAYVFVFNPLGVQADAIFTEGRGEDYSVDIVMQSQGVVTDEGYTVEVAIPFKSLRYEAGKNKLWGIHLFRRIKRFNNEQSSWMPLARESSGLLNQAGHISGLEGLSTERTLEFIPSLTVSESARRVRALSPAQRLLNPSLRDPGRLVNEPVTLDPGLTAKLGITPTITLDFAVNPDFAQVEADVPVVTANQRFPIFFAEKRPFFLEGIEIFQTPLTPVHTRAIIDPDYAVKFTGKQGRNTFGLMLASDNAPGNFIGDERLDSRNFPFLDKNAYIGVLRLRRNLGAENSLGLIATSYSFIERHNHLGGIDGRFRLNPQTTFDFQVLGANSRRNFFDPFLGRTLYRTGNGLAYSFNFDKSGRNFGYTLSGFGRTNDYRAEVGFTLRTNTNQQRLNFRYNSEPNPKAALVSYRASNITTVEHDWQGRSQNMRNEAQILLNFRRQGFIQAAMINGYERLIEEEFGPVRTATRRGTFAGEDSERSTRQTTVYALGQVTPTSKYTIFLFGLRTHGTFDFDFGAGSRFPRVSPGALLNPNAPLDPGPGNLTRFELTFIYQPTPAIRASLNFNKSRLVRHDTGRIAFDDDISIFRVTYQFTRNTFARARIDHTSLSSRLRQQFLLGWTPNPGTSFFVGYNDDLRYSGFSPFDGGLEPGFNRRGRSFFIKMSYLFRRSL